MNSYSDDEIKIITTAISRHSDKEYIHEPYDELLKDADVMDHCLYNTAFPIAQREIERYHNLLIEFGLMKQNDYTLPKSNTLRRSKSFRRVFF